MNYMWLLSDADAWDFCDFLRENEVWLGGPDTVKYTHWGGGGPPFAHEYVNPSGQNQIGTVGFFAGVEANDLSAATYPNTTENYGCDDVYPVALNECAASHMAWDRLYYWTSPTPDSGTAISTWIGQGTHPMYTDWPTGAP